MDAVVTAGGVPQPDELLYPFTQGKPKALLDICGKPMVQWVLDALSAAQRVETVVLIGLTEETPLACSKPMMYIPNKESMIENILGGIKKIMEINPSATRALIVSSDIPGITPEIVDWEIETTLQYDVDLCYNVVKREVIEARYPDSKRTFSRLKDAEVCGGDMNVVRTSAASKNMDIWKKLIDSRKNPIKQASIIGLDTLLLVLLRRLTMDEMVKKVASRLQLTGRAIDCPYAEIAMDVDKPHQLEIMRADLAKQVKH
jgi:GTP:adenosylcobinamide-phosphate guanylyltransferase